MPNAQPKIVQDPPIYTPFETHGRISDLWRSWTGQVSDAINRVGRVNNGGARTISTLAVGASPWTYQSQYAGDLRLLIAGGTGVSIQLSRDNITFYSVGVAAGMVTVSPNDFVKITYTIAPSVIAVPA